MTASFVQIPVSQLERMERLKLTPTQSKLWAFFWRLDPFGDGWIELPSPKELAEKFAVCERTIRRAAQRLEKLGLFDLRTRAWSMRNTLVSAKVQIPGKGAVRLQRLRRAPAPEAQPPEQIPAPAPAPQPSPDLAPVPESSTSAAVPAVAPARSPVAEAAALNGRVIALSRPKPAGFMHGTEAVDRRFNGQAPWEALEAEGLAHLWNPATRKWVPELIEQVVGHLKTCPKGTLCTEAAAMTWLNRRASNPGGCQEIRVMAEAMDARLAKQANGGETLEEAARRRGVPIHVAERFLRYFGEV